MSGLMKNNDGLPEGWKIKPIGEVCQFEKGKKPKNTGNCSDARTIPYINIKAFESGVPEEYAEQGNYPICSKDDVLIVWDGARSGLVGKGVSGYIGSTLSKVWSESTDDNYLFYFLKSQYGYVNTNTKGVGIPHVDPNILYAIQLPIAPFPEQKLIVSEIEKQFSRLDEAVAALKRVRASLKRYKAAVLKAAVEGRLTEEWRKENVGADLRVCPDSNKGQTKVEGQTHRFAPTKYETGADLLKRILAERKKKWEETNPKKKYKEPSAPNSSSLPELPKGWVWATAEQFCEFITKGTTPIAANLSEGVGEIPFLKVYNLTFTGRLNYEYKPTFVSRDTHEGELARSKVFTGDVLINIVGPPLGQVSIVPEAIPEANINQAIARYCTVGKISNRYLMLTLMSKKIMGWATKRAKTTAGQANLTLELCRALPVTLPPIAEQKRIVEEIESRLSVAEEIEETIDINLKRAERLRQAILKKAFSGRLI